VKASGENRVETLRFAFPNASCLVAGVKPRSQIELMDGFRVVSLRSMGRAYSKVGVANTAFDILTVWFPSNDESEYFQGAPEFLTGCREVAAIAHVRRTAFGQAVSAPGYRRLRLLLLSNAAVVLSKRNALACDHQPRSIADSCALSLSRCQTRTECSFLTSMASRQLSGLNFRAMTGPVGDGKESSSAKEPP